MGANIRGKGHYWKLNKRGRNVGFQVTGIGATIGNRVYALAELGWGSEYFAVGIVTGVRLGVGFKL